MRLNNLASVFLCFLLFSAFTGFEKGTISGVVTTNDGKPAYRATVKLLASDKPVITDTYGKFEYAALDAGVYELEISKEGFDLVRHSIVVDAGKTTHVTIQLDAVQLKPLVADKENSCR